MGCTGALTSSTGEPHRPASGWMRWWLGHHRIHPVREKTRTGWSPWWHKHHRPHPERGDTLSGVLHELWVEDGVGISFFLAGPMGDQPRSMLSPNAKLTWTVEAPNHVASMQALYDYLDWGEYRPVFPELDSVDYVTRGWDTSGQDTAGPDAASQDTASQVASDTDVVAPSNRSSHAPTQQLNDGVGDTDG
jgi:hypothetical protein